MAASHLVAENCAVGIYASSTQFNGTSPELFFKEVDKTVGTVVTYANSVRTQAVGKTVDCKGIGEKTVALVPTVKSTTVTIELRVLSSGYAPIYPGNYGFIVLAPNENTSTTVTYVGWWSDAGATANADNPQSQTYKLVGSVRYKDGLRVD